MCCFRLHFLILMCYLKKIKNLLQFTFEKIPCCAKREKKITCSKEKSQPPWILNGQSLTAPRTVFFASFCLSVFCFKNKFPTPHNYVSLIDS